MPYKAAATETGFPHLGLALFSTFNKFSTCGLSEHTYEYVKTSLLCIYKYHI